MIKKKYYVVWKGLKPGVYDNWKECEVQIKGFNGAQYKSFPTLGEAQVAFKNGNLPSLKEKKGLEEKISARDLKYLGKPITNSIAVDAAWNTATLKMEYRGVQVWDGKEIFRQGPYAHGTNNVGEFLDIVHALALLKKHNSTLPIYSDSRTAIKWVKDRKTKSKLEASHHNKELFTLMDRAERWLQENDYSTPVLKWETEAWGENPADFGRK